jgi:hypothetical protein
MLWAIVSSGFVIYLYRSLNATTGAEMTDGAAPANAINAELVKLNSRIDALENMTGGKTRGTMP